MFTDRVLSGMRPTGNLHLGHYHGVLKNWVEMQQEFECLFFVADWHGGSACLNSTTFGLCGSTGACICGTN